MNYVAPLMGAGWETVLTGNFAINAPIFRNLLQSSPASKIRWPDWPTNENKETAACMQATHASPNIAI